MRIQTIQITLSAAVVVAGCGGGGSEQPNAGPCVVNYTEPVVTISSAVNSSSIAPVSDVTLTNISLDGLPADLRVLAFLSSNIQVAGTTLVCKVPCSFSTTEGNYAMSVSAAGYQVAALSFVAKYSNFIGGCPATYSGSRSVSVSLQPL